MMRACYLSVIRALKCRFRRHLCGARGNVSKPQSVMASKDPVIIPDRRLKRVVLRFKVSEFEGCTSPDFDNAIKEHTHTYYLPDD